MIFHVFSVQPFDVPALWTPYVLPYLIRRNGYKSLPPRDAQHGGLSQASAA